MQGQQSKHLSCYPGMSWWGPNKERISALLALCEGNPPVTGGSLLLAWTSCWTNSWVWQWFEMLWYFWCHKWSHCNAIGFVYRMTYLSIKTTIIYNWQVVTLILEMHWGKIKSWFNFIFRLSSLQLHYSSHQWPFIMISIHYSHGIIGVIATSPNYSNIF